MTILKAVKKVENKLNKKMEFNSVNQHSVEFNNMVLSFYANGRYSEDASVTCINVRYVNDHSDSMTDYCAGSFYDNITQALNRVLQGRF